MSCSLVIVKRRHAGWHDEESFRVSQRRAGANRKVQTASLDRRGVKKHVSCDLNGLWTRVDQAEFNRMREHLMRSTLDDRDPCSWSVF